MSKDDSVQDVQQQENASTDPLQETLEENDLELEGSVSVDLQELQEIESKSSPPKPRLTVTSAAYYQAPDQQPFQASSSFYAWLETDEQPYYRRLEVPTSGTPLNLGWIEECSFLVLANDKESPCNVELRHKDSVIPLWIIPPGQSMQGTPVDIDSMRLIAVSEPCRLHLYALPR